MLALYRDGRQSEALEVYREFRSVLRDELGLDPSPQLRELEAAILRHDSLFHQFDRDGGTAGSPAGNRGLRPVAGGVRSGMALDPEAYEVITSTPFPA